MSAFDDFADKAQVRLLVDTGYSVDDDALRSVWDYALNDLSTQEGYTLRPDDPRYPQDRIAIEDAVMDQFGYDPDWREQG